MGIDAYQWLWIQFAVGAAGFVWFIGWMFTWGFCSWDARGAHTGWRYYTFLFIVTLIAWPWMAGRQLKRMLIAIVERRKL